MKLSTIFWILVLALIFYVGFKVVPIYYKGVIGIRGVCKEQADTFRKYGKEYVQSRIGESLNSMGIAEDQREYSVKVEEKNVIINITYWDSATFFDRYTKDFEFNTECEGVVSSVL